MSSLQNLEVTLEGENLSGSPTYLVRVKSGQFAGPALPAAGQAQAKCSVAPKESGWSKHDLVCELPDWGANAHVCTAGYKFCARVGLFGGSEGGQRGPATVNFKCMEASVWEKKSDHWYACS